MKNHLIFLSLLFWSLIPVRATTAFSEVFPRIDLDPSHRSATLLWLAEYGREQDWEPLTENTLRLIVQPVGIIEEAYEVNLNTGKVWVYPGTHDRTAKWAFDLTDESLTSLKQHLEAQTSLELPPTTRKAGFDGVNYFLEVEFRGRYQWLLHWVPDDEIVRTIFSVVVKESRDSRTRRSQ